MPSAVTLPVIDASGSAAEALRLMRDHACSAVIAFGAGRPLLYDAAQIVIALAKDPATRLSAMTPTTELAGTATMSRVSRARVLRIGSTSGRLRRAGASKAAISYRIDPFLLRRVAASPKDCYCSVDRKPVSGGSNGGDCPRGHRQSVRCV